MTTPRSRLAIGMAALGLAIGTGSFFAGRATVPATSAGKPGSNPQESSKPSSDGNLALSDAAMASVGLQTATVATGSLVQRLARPAYVAADPALSANVRPIDQGRVLSVDARPGAHVVKGDVLVTIDDPREADAAGQVSTALASLIRAEATAETADAAYARGRALAGGAVSAGEVLRRRMVARQAAAEVASQRAMLHDEQRKLAAYSPLRGQTGVSAIVAPLNGTVLRLTAGVGDIVDPANDVGLVADLGHVWLLATVFQSDIGRIDHTGLAIVTVPGLDGRTIEVPIDNIGETVDAGNGGIVVRMVVPNTDGMLRPGMVAEAALPMQRVTNALIVPENAVQDVDGRKTVFVQIAHGVFHARHVETGLQTQRQFEITKGLAAGETIVTQGGFALKSQSMQAELSESD